MYSPVSYTHLDVYKRQGLVCMMFIIAAKRDTFLFPHIRLLRKSQITNWIDVVRIGLPVALQSLFFSFLSMVIARLVAGWGDLAIAAQKVGGQIESISYMTAEGFGTAVNAFTAQNFGAKKPERIKKGYMTAIGIMAAWGIITTVISVSYTHLDVYKRQRYSRSGGFSCSCRRPKEIR